MSVSLRVNGTGNRNLTNLEWSFEYTGVLGCMVIPIEPKSKKPKGAKWQHVRLRKEQLPKVFADPRSGVGIHTGAPSGGLHDNDLDCREAIHAAEYLMPETGLISGRAGRPRSHRWYRFKTDKAVYVKLDDPISGKKAPNATLVELRGDNHQTVVPPSIHESGEPIIWYEYGEPAEVEKEHIVRLTHRVGAAALLIRYWPKGNRHYTALALAGGLHRASWSAEEILQFVQVVATGAGDNEVEDRLTAVRDTITKLEAGDKKITGWPALAEHLGDVGQRVVAEICKWLSINKTGTSWALSDIGNAERLVDRHRADICYCEALGWLVWDGRRYAIDETYQIERWAKETVRAIPEEAAKIQDDTIRLKTLKHAIASEANSRINAMIERARAEEGVAVRVDDLDNQPFLLNLQNGTYDLEQNVLLPPERSHLLTKVSPVHYDPEATCPLWERFLRETVQGDAGMIRFLQQAAGYSLCGEVWEKILFILCGRQSSGKTTFINALMDVMGKDYARPVLKSAIMAKPRNDNSVPVDLADLAGARLIYIAEPSAGQQLNEAVVKELTGRDRMKARRLYKDPFEFTMQGKLWLGTNHAPVISKFDGAIADRIKIIPFARSLAENEQDRQLGDKLKLELPGILNWMLAGWRDYRANGLVYPEAVKEATADYVSDQDVVGQFIETACIQNVTVNAPANRLYETFKGWCEGNGHRPLTSQLFKGRLIELGYVCRRKNYGYVWQDIGLPETSDEFEDEEFEDE